MNIRKLSPREKVLLGIVAVVCVVVLSIQIAPMIHQGLFGGGLAEKQKKLRTAQTLVSLAEMTAPMEATLRTQVGTQGRVISDLLFADIEGQITLVDLNAAHREKDLADLLPALEGKADSILAYKEQNGALENLEALKEIQGPIFEGEQPEAVISRQIADLARRAELSPNYQLNIKPMPAKKPVKLPPQTRKIMVDALSLSGLEAEKLQKGLAHVPLTYQPEIYLVDMTFKSEIEPIIQLIQQIQSTTKWLQVRDVKLSVADKKKTTLSVNLSLIAQVF